MLFCLLKGMASPYAQGPAEGLQPLLHLMYRIPATAAQNNLLKKVDNVSSDNSKDAFGYIYVPCSSKILQLAVYIKITFQDE